jgi:hypothetical protein
METNLKMMSLEQRLQALETRVEDSARFVKFYPKWAKISDDFNFVLVADVVKMLGWWGFDSGSDVYEVRKFAQKKAYDLCHRSFFDKVDTSFCGLCAEYDKVSDKVVLSFIVQRA